MRQPAGEAISLDIAGARIAGLRWAGGSWPVLALHGWLDNAASFSVLGPLLADAGADVVALDLPGHGHSDHKPAQGSYNLWDDLLDLLRVADQLGWERFHLVGHSRGAMMSALLAVAMPERVASTVLLDALSPQPLPVADTFAQLGRFLREYLTAPRNSGGRYRSVEQAVETLCRVTGIDPRSARPIVERGTIWRDERWQWRVDPRVKLASAFKLSEAQNAVLLKQLAQLPCLLLLAEGGLGARMAQSGELDRLRGIPWELLPGSHHFHMEAQAPLIADRIHRFWQQAGPADTSTG